MKNSLLLAITFLILSATSQAQAQVDPSSAILLRSGGRTPTKGEYDSNRYSIRPGAAKPEKLSAEKSAVKVESSVQTPKVTAESSVQQGATQTTTTKVTTGTESDLRQPSKSADKIVQKIEITEPEQIVGETAAEVPVAAEPEKKPEVIADKNLVQDLRQIFLGGSSEEVDLYLGKVEPSDPRNNVLEFTIAPMIFYNDSASTYWYRDYFSYGLGLSLNAKLWLSPFFGISTTYQTSFNSEVKTSVVDNSTEPVNHQWFGAELQFRSYFGVSRKAPSLTFGLGFNEYKMKTKSDSTSRIGVKTSGVKLSLESVIPATRGTAWTMGLELEPRANHSELKGQISPKSGKHDQTNIIGFSLGKRYTFSRSQVVFWKLHHSFEKNSFKNQATEVDPEGNQPSNVSVTNTRSMFLFGFTWGN